MIYSKNPPENYSGNYDVELNQGQSAIIIAYVTTIGFITGAILFILVLFWLFCFCQAKRKAMNIFATETCNEADKAKATRHPCQNSIAYHTRVYCGCLPRCQRCRPFLSKRRDCRLKPCWLTLCCCYCKELKSDDQFLDDHWSTTDNSPSPERSKPRGSIFSPDEIVLPNTRNQASVCAPAGKHVASVEFYSYRLHGVGEEDMVL